MQWAGAGVIWSFAGGVPSSRLLNAEPAANPGDFSFVQISDSRVGFGGPANPDVNGTLQVAIDRINALEHQPDLILHTGDLTHLAKDAEFYTLEQQLRGVRQRNIVYVPGEHDLIGDGSKRYMERFGQNALGNGWRSFDHKGVHFIGLNNAAQLDGLGNIGAEQMTWLKRDLGSLTASTPVVVFAHIPLWAVYPQWGWSTKDSAEAMDALKRFGSVTVLNGHIHQVMQKVEGAVTFYTAASIAFPQPAPGSAPSPGPMNSRRTAARRLGHSRCEFCRRTAQLGRGRFFSRLVIVPCSRCGKLANGGARVGINAEDFFAGSP